MSPARSTCWRRCASSATPRLVHTSTSETYGTAQTVPITEDHPINTQSPYAASKAGGDRLADSYHASFDTPVVTLRPVQHLRAAPVDAGGDPDRDRPGRGRASARSRLGRLRPTRDFIFVKDTAPAFLAVGTAPAEEVVGRTFNAGTGGEISVGDLVALIGKVMDTDARRARGRRAHPARRTPR